MNVAECGAGTHGKSAFDELPLTRPEQFTSAALDALDAEILSVFSASELIAPDDVRV